MLTREQVLRDLPERVEPRALQPSPEAELLYCRRCGGIRLFQRQERGVLASVGLFVLLPIWLFFLTRPRHRCTVCGRAGGRSPR